jgi:FeS assembly protein IscX
MALTWQSTREVGERLFERYDSVNPLTVRAADLRKWVVDLEDFQGKPDEATDQDLEAIQRAWHEEWKNQYGAE